MFVLIRIIFRDDNFSISHVSKTKNVYLLLAKKEITHKFFALNNKLTCFMVIII